MRNTLGGIGFMATPMGLSILSEQKSPDTTPKKIVCVGAHPDDPESGCGGTLAKFSQAGHQVTILYLTRGEAGIPGKSHDEAAAIRTREATEACQLLNAKPLFFGQIDGDSVLDNRWLTQFRQVLDNEQPDCVFTHWPIDSHKDHQVTSLLTIQTWLQAARKFELYFFEVCAGEQTMTFHPTDYVDITATQELKRKAVYCHQSQVPASIYNCGHTLMEEFRGIASGFGAAEGFVRMTGKGQGNEAGF